MNYTCPVCGYNNLRFPPSDFTICPSCGTEFGNDDFELTHAEIRERWIAAGARWFSDAVPQPNNWNPFEQLIHAFLPKTLADSHVSKVALTVIGRGLILKPTTPQVVAPGNTNLYGWVFSATSSQEALAAL